MITEFVRDQAFTIAWFGLMCLVWFGWAQEDPPRAWRWRLGLGSIAGLTMAGVFGSWVFGNWSEPTALDGRYPWFGALVAVEVLAAGIGCVYLARSGRGRWMAWWVACVVAAHFVPLAWLLDDPSLAVVGVVQVLALAALVRPLRVVDTPASRLVGPVMGVTLLAFSIASAVVFVVQHGAPWGG